MPEQPDFSDILSYHNGFAKYKNVKSHLVIDGGMTTLPLVSIMIPTFRRPGYLREAIKSALHQDTNIPYEVVVVDNEQDTLYTEQVDSVVSSFNVSNLYLYRNEQNIGMFGNWNRCIELSRSESITILNDDDQLFNKIVESISKYYTYNNLIAHKIIECSNKYFKKRKTQKLKSFIHDVIFSRRELLVSDFLFSNPLRGSLGVFFNKAQAQELGGFNELLYPSSDYVFFTRYCITYGGIYIRNADYAIYNWEDNASLKHETKKGFYNIDNLLRYAILNKLKNENIALIQIATLEILCAIYKFRQKILIEEPPIIFVYILNAMLLPAISLITLFPIKISSKGAKRCSSSRYL